MNVLTLKWVLSQNVRIMWKNTLAYFSEVSMMKEKSFIPPAECFSQRCLALNSQPRLDVIKLFRPNTHFWIIS
jgi:hypothetical protein